MTPHTTLFGRIAGAMLAITGLAATVAVLVV